MAATKSSPQSKPAASKIPTTIHGIAAVVWAPLLRLSLLMRLYSQERTMEQIVSECRDAERYVLQKDASSESDDVDEQKEGLEAG